MKRHTLIYLIYCIILLFSTLLFTLKIIEKNEVISFVAKVIQPIKEKSQENDLINSLIGYHKAEENNIDVNESKNSEGFKDYEHKIIKQNNTFRIMALGDSMTEGAFVVINNTWPKQLERKLNILNLSITFEVFNMGGPVFDSGTYDEVMAFKNIGLKYKPDMIILQYYGGDWRSPEMKAKAKEVWKYYKEGRYKLPSDIENEIRRLNASESEISRIIYDVVSREYYANVSYETDWDKWVKTSITELVGICQNKSIRLIVITWDTENFKQESNKLFFVLRNFSIPYYDFSEYLQYSPCPSSIRLNDCHLSPLGYEIVANKTFEIILNQNTSFISK